MVRKIIIACTVFYLCGFTYGYKDNPQTGKKDLVTTGITIPDVSGLVNATPTADGLMKKGFYTVNNLADLTAAVVTYSGTGVKITLAPGAYTVPANGLNYNAYTNLTIDLTGVTLKWPDHTGTAWTGEYAFWPGSGFTIIRGTVDGNKVNQIVANKEGGGGIVLFNVNNVILDNVEIKNCVANGLYANTVTNLNVINLYSHDQYNLPYPNYPFLDFISYDHPVGALIYRATNANFTNLRVENNGLDGFFASECTNLSVNGAYANNNGLGILNFQTYYPTMPKGAGGITAVNSINTKFIGITANNNTESGVQYYHDPTSLVVGTDLLISDVIAKGNSDAGVIVNDIKRAKLINIIATDNGSNPVNADRSVGVYVGIYDAVGSGGTDDVTLINVTSKNTTTGLSRVQNYGIKVDASATNVSGTNISATNNITKDYSNVPKYTDNNFQHNNKISTVATSEIDGITNLTTVANAGNNTAVIAGINNSLTFSGTTGSDATEVRALVNQVYNASAVNVSGNLQANVSAGGILGVGNIANLFLYRAETYSPGAGTMTNVYGYYSDLSAGNATNRYHFYGTGNYPSYFGGLVQSAAGGFKFPDDTIQTTAATGSLPIVTPTGTGLVTLPAPNTSYAQAAGQTGYVLPTAAQGGRVIIDTAYGTPATVQTPVGQALSINGSLLYINSGQKYSMGAYESAIFTYKDQGIGLWVCDAKDKYIASSGSVTSVTSANADVSVATATTTPVLTLNSGIGANQIVKLDSSAQLGIGTTTPITNAEIYSTTAVPQLTVRDEVTSASGGGGISLFHSNASDTFAVSGDRLGILGFGSRSGGVSRTGADIQAYAAENFVSTTNNGSYIIFRTVSIGSGTRAERLRITSNGHTEYSGATPAVATCGTSPSVVGNDNTGTITVGSGVVMACTLNFVANANCTAASAPFACCTGSGTGTCSAGWTNNPNCFVTGNSLITLDVTAKSTTSITFGASATVAGGTLDYFCVGRR